MNTVSMQNKVGFPGLGRPVINTVSMQGQVWFPGLGMASHYHGVNGV